jgi:WhiB family redox-sensing transcriptional regulator
MIPSAEWRERALCAGMADATFAVETNDPFYTPGGDGRMGRPRRDAPKRDEYTEARAICAQCPVVAECLADAFSTRDYHGFRGGLTGDERITMFRRHQRHGAPLPVDVVLVDRSRGSNEGQNRKPYTRTAPKPPPNEWPERELHYHAGRTDREISELTGDTQSAIRCWRQARGYAPNKAAS